MPVEGPHYSNVASSLQRSLEAMHKSQNAVVDAAKQIAAERAAAPPTQPPPSDAGAGEGAGARA